MPGEGRALIFEKGNAIFDKRSEYQGTTSITCSVNKLEETLAGYALNLLDNQEMWLRDKPVQATKNRRLALSYLALRPLMG
ncbi:MULTISPECIES: hypothetical protein [unclassified Legionella]|uniref:hypothetical protein n=1 Tax=unclassified Legionella TaxID=2622702 RepID=UPI0010567359|nr:MULTISPECIES: hypothetical protein [unclassified Legionella]MDI9819118.1 hypothetical protein [Legionella sp. PL877]